LGTKGWKVNAYTVDLVTSDKNLLSQNISVN